MEESFQKSLTKRLQANWNEKMYALACKAEARFYDPLSRWECIVLAQNPADEDEIFCIINGAFLEATLWSFRDLRSMFNEAGEPPRFDEDFVPQSAAQIFKKLGDGSWMDERSRD